MYIVGALLPDKRFKEGLVYVEATIQAWQRATQLNGVSQFPLDLDIDEIAMTIDERSDAYEVGSRITTPRVVNPYAKSSIRKMTSDDVASIHVMKRRDDHRTGSSKPNYST